MVFEIGNEPGSKGVRHNENDVGRSAPEPGRGDAIRPPGFVAALFAFFVYFFSAQGFIGFFYFSLRPYLFKTNSNEN
jgi:hypothetical protein